MQCLSDPKVHMKPIPLSYNFAQSTVAHSFLGPALSRGVSNFTFLQLKQTMSWNLCLRVIQSLVMKMGSCTEKQTCLPLEEHKEVRLCCFREKSHIFYAAHDTSNSFLFLLVVPSLYSTRIWSNPLLPGRHSAVYKCARYPKASSLPPCTCLTKAPSQDHAS